MIKKLSESRGNVLGVELIGRETRGDILRLRAELDKLLQQYEKVNLLLLLDNFQGWKLTGFQEHVKLYLQCREKFGRVAVVGDKLWKELLVHLNRSVYNVEEKYFNRENYFEAWQWVRENSLDSVQLPSAILPHEETHNGRNSVT